MKPKRHDNINNSKSSLPDSVRPIDEMIDAERLLFLQVWFNRNKNALFANEHGDIVINRDGTHPTESGDLPPLPDADYRVKALELVQDSFKCHGHEKFGPWTDFEWGMINGKLSAIRWMLGDEWDMLDT